MKVGDLVQRKYEGFERLGIGIILSLQLGGMHPVHPCATVFYPKSLKIWDIAESLIEVTIETT
jgi:hypothetical protein